MVNFVGTAADDTFFGGASDDTATGNDGDDTLYGGGGLDDLNGGNDNDYLDGGTGADVLNGGNGNDRMIADVGDDANGGAGLDILTLDLSTVSSNLTKVFDFSAGHANSIGGSKFQNVEVLQLTTGSGNDTITFDSTAIYGSSPYGGYWYGGNGTDRAIIDWSDQIFSITGNTGAIAIGTTNIGLSGVERFDFTGGSGNDNFLGGADVDKFLGNAGNDNLNGQGGNDTLDGGDGNDTINAGNSTDNAGIDTILGGTGDDSITAAFKDSIDGGTGRDSLTLDLSDRSADAVLAFDPTTSNTIQTTTFNHIEATLPDHRKRRRFPIHQLARHSDFDDHRPRLERGQRHRQFHGRPVGPDFRHDHEFGQHSVRRFLLLGRERRDLRLQGRLGF